MTTLNDLYWNTRSLALGGLREEYNTLANSLLVQAQGYVDTVNITGTPGSLQTSVVFEIDYEQMLILSESGNSFSVIRGWNNSTPSAHSAGAVLTVEPEFTAYDIIAALNQELDDLSSPDNGLYQTLECTLTYNPVVTGYDMTDSVTGLPVADDEIIEIIEVRDHDYGPYQAWPIVRPSMYKLQRNADTTIFPSGLALNAMRVAIQVNPLGFNIKLPTTPPWLIQLTTY